MMLLRSITQKASIIRGMPENSTVYEVLANLHEISVARHQESTELALPMLAHKEPATLALDSLYG
ncbi:hypothetical protein [Altererythrobacter sp. MTPC7]|uniref:hypothetical protein n=1 Tax=Altererythrobacter sp. MTPC7 TaxID=3056567 RepID=UPI0036F427DB